MLIGWRRGVHGRLWLAFPVRLLPEPHRFHEAVWLLVAVVLAPLRVASCSDELALAPADDAAWDAAVRVRSPATRGFPYLE